VVVAIFAPVQGPAIGTSSSHSGPAPSRRRRLARGSARGRRGERAWSSVTVAMVTPTQSTHTASISLRVGRLA